MTPMWLVLAALECADAFAQGYARGLWHGAGAALIVVGIIAVIVWAARRH